MTIRRKNTRFCKKSIKPLIIWDRAKPRHEHLPSYSSLACVAVQLTSCQDAILYLSSTALFHLPQKTKIIESLFF